MTKVGISILAGGEGTRLCLDIPKALAPVLGRKLVDFPILAAKEFINHRKLEQVFGVVVGHRSEEVEKYVSSEHNQIEFAFQKKQLGTADALKSYFENVNGAKETDYTIVLCADTPLIRKKDLDILFETITSKALDAVVATFSTKKPHGYGRIVRKKKGLKIIEEKDTSCDQRLIKEVNSGLYIAKTKFILNHIYQIDSNNNSGEFYLTDIFNEGYNVQSFKFKDSYKFLGVNTLSDLERVTTFLRKEKNEILQTDGVYFIDSSSCYIDWDVVIKKGTKVYPNSILEGPCKIGRDVIIGAGSVITNSIIEDGVEIKPYCVLEKCLVRKESTIGPYTRLRPDSDIGERSKIGNFVEIKKSKLENEVKVSHLSYVGDAEIGAETNIGCGFITCNYDGAKKHLTKIGKKTFIGSDTQVVAPIEIGDECYVASGSTITSSMENGSFAIARSRQLTRPELAKKFLKNKKD